jgi:OOP family OmpA-OmpF porin
MSRFSIPRAGACAGLAAMAALLMIVAVPAAAEQDERGYWTSPDGEPVMTRYGECWRTQYPPESDQSEIARMCGDIADSDGDGVYDDADECPGTPEGAEVDDAGCPLDSDGDGVADYADACPGTEAGRPVDDQGCVLDSDGDGIADDRDECPGTAAGARVDTRGCEIPERINVDVRGGEFDFDSAELTPAMEQALDDVARRLRESEVIERLRIVGHTDSVGAADYNRELSQRRAEAVADYLADRGLDRDAMTVEGRGETEPVATNETEAGRAENRRVVIITE